MTTLCIVTHWMAFTLVTTLCVVTHWMAAPRPCKQACRDGGPQSGQSSAFPRGSVGTRLAAHSDWTRQVNLLKFSDNVFSEMKEWSPASLRSVDLIPPPLGLPQRSECLATRNAASPPPFAYFFAFSAARPMAGRRKGEKKANSDRRLRGSGQTFAPPTRRTGCPAGPAVAKSRFSTKSTARKYIGSKPSIR